MNSSAWQRLSKADSDQYWRRLYGEFNFSPGIDKHLVPRIKVPKPSVTWSVEVALSDPDPLMPQTLAAFNEAMHEVFKQVVPPLTSLIVLDWMHTCYRFFPHRHVGSFVPRAHTRGEPTTWEVPVFPYGEYFIFLAEDCRFGTFGDPWEVSICAWGDELLDAMRELPLQGSRIIRRHGIAV